MVVVCLLVVLVVSARVAQLRVRAAGGSQRSTRPRLDRRLRRRPVPDAADLPPAGLAPLLDSPRLIALECARGIRELEQWLADQATA